MNFGIRLQVGVLTAFGRMVLNAYILHIYNKIKPTSSPQFISQIIKTVQIELLSKNFIKIFLTSGQKFNLEKLTVVKMYKYVVCSVKTSCNFGTFCKKIIDDLKKKK